MIDLLEDLKDFIKIVLIPVSIVLIPLILLVFSVCYFGSAQEVKVYNKYHKTNYTAWEWLWAGGTIRSYIEEGEHKKIEINLKESK